MVTGKIKLALTATTAAHSVLSIYMIVTIRNCWPFPFPAFAIELMTRANTSIGAIALSALTNMVPIRSIPVAPGTRSPSTAPITIPTNIFAISDTLFHISTIFFMNLTPNYIYISAF